MNYVGITIVLLSEEFLEFTSRNESIKLNIVVRYMFICQITGCFKC